MTNTEMITELEKYPANTELEIAVMSYKDGRWDFRNTYLINTDKQFHYREYKDEKALQILCGAVEIIPNP